MKHGSIGVRSTVAEAWQVGNRLPRGAGFDYKLKNEGIAAASVHTLYHLDIWVNSLDREGNQRNDVLEFFSFRISSICTPLHLLI